MSILTAVETVLAEAGEPLHYRDITERVLQRGLWTTTGRTPDATVNAQLAVDIKRRGEGSVFRRTDKGVFALRAWGIAKGHAPIITTPTIEKHLSFTDAAEAVLDKYAGKSPMHYRAITNKALELGLIATAGKTPEATLYAQIITEIHRRTKRGERPRFIRYGKGYVGLSKWKGIGLAFQIDQHNQHVRKKLIQQIGKMPPAEFEALIGTLLAKLGFEDVTVTSFKGDGGIDVRGAPVPQYMIRVRHPKICTACLRENSYARKIWELAPATACPIHRCLLLDECPKCARRITWARAKVSVCQCDFDWRDCETLLVGELELRVSSQIHLRCKLRLPEVFPGRRAAEGPINNTDLKSFLSALFFIASQYAGVMDTKGKHLAPSMRCAELHPLLCKAFSAFDKWPDNYFAFLEWRKGQAAATQLGGGLRKDFSGYKSALYTQLASSQLDFMRSAFETYLSSRWDGGYTAHLKRLDDAARVNRRYASRREAKALLKVSAQGVDRIIAAGRLKAVVCPRKGGRLILIERACLHEFKLEIEHSLYLKQVEAALGVSRVRIMELVNASLLSPLSGPCVDGRSDWKFSKKETDGLSVRVRGKVSVATSGTEDTVSFFMALRKVARYNISLAQFLKAILDNEIAPCGENDKPGLAALLFSKAQVSNYARRQRHKEMGKTYSAAEAARLLGVTQDVVYFLVRKEILSSRSKDGERYPNLLIDGDGLEKFNSAYVLPAKVAKKLGTVSVYLIRLLATHGIQPVSGPTVDGGKQYVFRKSDFDAIDINGLVPIRG